LSVFKIIGIKQSGWLIEERKEQITIQGTGVIPVYPNKQDKNQKLRKVQSLYRKKKHKNKTEGNVNKIGTVVVSICIILFFFFFITSVLFDIGVPLLGIFGR
jgi:hypothetical protein